MKKLKEPKYKHPFKVYLLNKPYLITCKKDMMKFMNKREKYMAKMSKKEFQKKERYYEGSH